MLGRRPGTSEPCKRGRASWWNRSETVPVGFLGLIMRCPELGPEHWRKLGQGFGDLFSSVFATYCGSTIISQ